MVNNLCATFRVDRAKAVEWITAAGLDEKVRGEKLMLEELARLSDAITIHNS
jgi:16S rRNA (adenine1518-N6/adenine1519-N6)-dimethyltransferase